MKSPKDVLVVTTSTVEGVSIKRHLKPVSAHVVAGTNLINDFFAGWSDVFGGRSRTYQLQLTSLYNEAIERIKIAAYQLGGNCVLGLNIDIDEISGKGKSMFMITAIGTATIIEKKSVDENYSLQPADKLENVDVDRINALRRKNKLLRDSSNETLRLNEDIWEFITTNQVHELYPYLLKKLIIILGNDDINLTATTEFARAFTTYVDSLPEDIKLNAVYNSVSIEENKKILPKIYDVIKELHLFDFAKVMQLLDNSNFEIQKRAIKITTFDKPFYNKEDKEHLKILVATIESKFPERGKRTTKKQLLSSKEKEVWLCECGKTSDIDSYCACGKDIKGFTEAETSPATTESYIREKIELLAVYVG